MIGNIFLFIIFIFLSAFFSASETAIFSLGNLKLRKIAEKHPKGKIVKNLLKNPTHLLSAIVFGNLLVNIGLVSFSTAIFVRVWGERGLILAIALSGTLILFLGEIFPKTLAIYTAEKLSLPAARILNVLAKVFSPFIWAIEKIVGYFSSFVLRRHKKSKLSDEEFKAALLLSQKDGQISAQEEDMISHVLEFKDTRASEILTARIDIKGIDSALSPGEVLDFLKVKQHSKFPVFEGSLDHITGILYAKDVFLNPDQDYHSLLRAPVFIPESKGIDDILKVFLEKKERIAIVLDEYGGCAGLVTMEDIVEEIFGEIYDEFEKREEPLEDLGGGAFRVYGKTPIKTVNLELELDLPEDEDTVAGFLLSKMEKIPRPGESFKFNNIEFVVERATARRIVSIILKIRR